MGRRGGRQREAPVWNEKEEAYIALRVAIQTNLSILGDRR